MDTGSAFDVVVLGTGLTESISAAALAKAGLSVLQVDTNSYYGSNEACLTTKELLSWLETSSSEFVGCSGQELGASSSRSYALSLAPSIIPATGPLISSLIGSGVSRYGEFKLMQKLSVFLDGKFRKVPGNKEDIFKSKDLSLIDKRKLMRFLTFAMGDFENAEELKGQESTPFVQFLKNAFLLTDALIKTIAYALALNTLATDQTLDSLKRLRTFLRSSGKYGPSPFLVGLFGGLGELSQGFCRSCAVSGGTYMLNQGIESIAPSSSQPSNPSENARNSFRLTLSGAPETMACKLIVSSRDFSRYLPNTDVESTQGSSEQEITAYGIVVLKTSISLNSFSDDGTPDEESSSDEPEKIIDAGMLVFPPGELVAGNAPGAVNVLINGEGVSSCPRGETVLYFTSRLPPEFALDFAEHLFASYLDATLSAIIPWQNPNKAEDPTLPDVIFKAFYTRRASPYPSTTDRLHDENVVLCEPLTSHIALNGDDAAKKAEMVFRTALKKLGVDESDGRLPFWPPLDIDGDDDDD
ncbi:FAD/NAD(P)-binding domain-containing protein [Schizopora paradoxa]|uniref:FAD/NAD(P)-binding domain-containing protein n=1 Tax=Schizopora paradoxa TaxID=27342 RepID=A0A0H2RZJ0_9AGAM|nr:FAD/NAD(P)-binding domain-containing protein [Schizopora paradoxa]